MKTRADVEAWRRELETRLNILNNDDVFLGTARGPVIIAAFQNRLKALNDFADNLILLDWLVNPDTDVTRAQLINQDLI